MAKFRIYLQTTQKKYVLFGFIFDWKVRAWELDSLKYAKPPTRTTIGFIPPNKWKDGVNSRIWGYDKLNIPEEESNA